MGTCESWGGYKVAHNPTAHGQLPSRGATGPSPKCDQGPADREGIRKTVLITFVSPENAGSSPRNSARSQVAMATGGNRLKLGRVLALPGWSCLAGHTLKGRDLSTCWVLIRGRSSPSCEGEAGPHTAPSTLCLPVPPTGRWAAALPAKHAAAALIVSRSVTPGLSPPAQLLLLCSLCVSVDEPEPGGQQWPWP